MYTTTYFDAPKLHVKNEGINYFIIIIEFLNGKFIIDPEKKKSFCQMWDSNPRPHTRTRMLTS